MTKTALVLSGGGSRGGYEIGVWQALHRLDIPIDIVTGTSVGAINGAMVVQNKRNLSVRLWQSLTTDMIFDLEPKDATTKHSTTTPFAPKKDARHPEEKPAHMLGGIPPKEALAYAREIITNGGAGHSGLARLLYRYISEDAVRASSIDYGLVTVEFPSMKPHYLSLSEIPYGQLHAYILASASCFPAVQVMRIGDTRFIDGGYADVMPVEMAMDKGADRIIAVDLQAAGFQRSDTIKKAQETLDAFHIIKSPWDLGSFLVFDQDNTKRLIRLGYLDTMRTFGRLDGEKYAFRTGAFSPGERIGAENAADLFELDPTMIYTRRKLHQHLQKKIASVPTVEKDELPTMDELRALAHKGTIVLLIAEDLRKKAEDSFFLTKPAYALLKDEVSAANYLLKNNLF